MIHSTLWFKGFVVASMLAFPFSNAMSQQGNQPTNESLRYSRGYNSAAVAGTVTKAQVRSSIVTDHSLSAQKPSSCSAVSLGACEIPVLFSNLNLSIPDDDAAGVTSSQIVSGVPGSNLGVDIQLKRVCFTITHSWVGDLQVLLTAPNGTTIALTDRPGLPADPFGCDGNNLDVCVTGGIGNPMEDECNNNPAIAGIWTAVAPDDLNKINVIGGNPNGTWELLVIDNAQGDTGSVSNWSLIFDNGPNATWTSPGDYCDNTGILDLTTLVIGTSGGTWSGIGVNGSNFDPNGLSGNIAITYTVTDLTTGCTDSLTNYINVASVPVVGFNANVVSGTLTVNFVNTSTGNSTYLWDFGDGTTSTDTNTTHTYPGNSVYTVTLTATNACGSFTSTQQVPVQGCPDLIQDGGFEATPGGWIAFSTNFNSPVCNISLCGNGSGTGPYTGNNWAWFGGSNTTFEEGSMTQSVNIPTGGSATLLFQLEQIACDSPNDFLKIAVDQDTVFVTDGTSSLCGQFGYTQQSVNLNAYADGLNHQIKFFSRSYVTNGGASNFFVDNVELRFCTGIGVAETSANSFSIVPNPAKTFIELNFTDLNSTGMEIRITDLSGREIYRTETGKVSGNQKFRVETAGFSKGIYVVSAISGNSVMNQKLVIQ